MTHYFKNDETLKSEFRNIVYNYNRIILEENNGFIIFFSKSWGMLYKSSSFTFPKLYNLFNFLYIDNLEVKEYIAKSLCDVFIKNYEKLRN